MSSINTNIKQIAAFLALLAIFCYSSLVDAKLLRRSRFYEDPIGSYDGPYGNLGGATGERAIVTVRGARNPYDGSAPSKIAIEDNPYRGPYPRGVYDRLDSSYSRGIGSRMPYYPQSDYGYNSGYNRGGYGGYGSG